MVNFLFGMLPGFSGFLCGLIWYTIIRDFRFGRKTKKSETGVYKLRRHYQVNHPKQTYGFYSTLGEVRMLIKDTEFMSDGVKVWDYRSDTEDAGWGIFFDEAKNPNLALRGVEIDEEWEK